MRPLLLLAAASSAAQVNAAATCNATALPGYSIGVKVLTTVFPATFAQCLR